MRIILLSGGSGKRLWPMSNEVRSKQFLKLLDAPDGSKESMIQRMVRQLTDAGMGNDITVATSVKQIDLINSQLGEKVDVVTEPERRNTYPAIALASMYLHHVKGVDKDETVVVIPCDTYTEPSYFEALSKIAEAVTQRKADIVLMGVKAADASPKYGYIVPGKKISDQLFTVDTFREKPDAAESAAMFVNDAYWNGGVFAFRLGYMLDRLAPYCDYADIAARYSELPKISFDYEVVEKTGNLAVVPFNGMWKDLGSWDALFDNVPQPTIGNVICDTDIHNTHIINELDLPIVCTGCDNLIVAASSDGILISGRNASDTIKSKIKGLHGRPMFEERRWGFYKVIGKTEHMDGHCSLTKLLHLLADHCISYQRHSHRDEIWTFIDGEGLLVIDGVTTKVGRGDVAHIQRGQLHSIRAITDLEIIEVQSGNPLIEEDIERFPWDWDKK